MLVILTWLCCILMKALCDQISAMVLCHRIGEKLYAGLSIMLIFRRWQFVTEHRNLSVSMIVIMLLLI
ncbi:hypothetical protein QQ73_07525 [Candidatus Endoriftia persephone str. Guaymas]|nr:hypothetical protein [Candidatus Endoriftia persephone str. Guaymas]